LKRGLFLLAAAALALPLGGASARGPGASRAARAEIVVTLQRSVPQSRFLAALHRVLPQATVRWRYRLVLDGFALLVPPGSGSQLARLPGVTGVYPGVRYHQSLYRSPFVIGAPQVWGPDLATAGQGIKIGIIDDGIDQTHPFFSPAGYSMPPGFPKGNTAYTTAKVIVARSFPPPGLKDRYRNLPFDPVASEHGTHVAGIAAGDHGTSAPGPGPGGRVSVSGIAPAAYLGNYRVLTIPTGQFGLDGNSPEIVAGIEAAVRDGMDVINLSLGEPEITPKRDIVVQAIDGAAQEGVVPVIAAGNDFDSLGFGSIDSPGSAPDAITAAAATKEGAIASFSSGGPTPYSLRLKPDVAAPGVSILSSVPARYGSWREFDGTSMAAPHVAGAAALLKQRHPDWSVADIKSALVTTGNPVAANGRQAPPTRVGGGMIWLPRADQPLLFASPTSLSFGYLRRGHARTLTLSLANAGGGAGSWSVSVQKSVTPRGVSLSAPATATVPGKVALRAAAARSAADADASGYLVLTRGADVRRIPYWLHVTARALAREPVHRLRGPGTYRGNTRRGRALVSSYKFPSNPGGVGIRNRFPGPEEVFRFVIRRPVANAGAVVTSRARGVTVTPRLVRAGDEDQLAGFTALPIRVNPYQSGFYGPEPAVGVFRPARGAYELVFDTPSRRAAGPFTFRFWVNDTTAPAIRLLTASVRAGAPLRVTVRDRGSGVDPTSLFARVDGHYRTVFYDARRGLAQVVTSGLSRGRHKLFVSASDYQETKNNENGARTLPNTRRLTASFVVR
jgi:subtilisin family serine protease